MVNEGKTPTFEDLESESPEAYRINVQYLAEIEEYNKSTVASCGREKALKLLKKFSRKYFREFWQAPVAEYLPAVSEGIMKLQEKIYSHDEAVIYAKKLILELDVKQLARDFLYGVAHNAPEYRTALASYYYIKNLPEHEFKKSYVGQAPTENGFEDRYCEYVCEICGYDHKLSIEPKMQFYWINEDMEKFYFGEVLFNDFSLNAAIIFLEEYIRQQRSKCSKSNYEHFMQVIDVIENSPLNTTSGKLRKILKQSGLLKMTMGQIEACIDMLGFLNILHSDDAFGVTVGHTCKKDMLGPLSDRSYAAHPVNRWTRKCGIDYDSISMLFDDIYD